MELITKLSGLLKATEETTKWDPSSAKPITYTIRVRFRTNFKTVWMYENFVVQYLISSLRRAVLLGSFAALGFSVVWNELQMCLTVGLGYCSGILNRLVVLTFQELGTFSIKVKDLSVCNCKVVKA